MGGTTQHLLITPFLHSLPTFGTAEGDTEPALVAQGLHAQQSPDVGEDEPPLAQLGSPAASGQAPEPGAGRGESRAEPPRRGLLGKARHRRPSPGAVHACRS